MPVLFEFKARSNQSVILEEKLQSLQPRFAGEDHQTDTYFNVTDGRLKLREGAIENALIYYQRSDVVQAKQSDVLLYQQADKSLKQVLTAALGIKVVVEKRRRIWFVNNVKIHFDRIEGLGEFVEVEAINMSGEASTEDLKKQCRQFAEMFQIEEEDYIAHSYSDLILRLQ
jgi:adenylate cyclase class 2